MKARTRVLSSMWDGADRLVFPHVDRRRQTDPTGMCSQSFKQVVGNEGAPLN